MALELKGKTALVTGGGAGICFELTKKLLAAGCNVLVADINLRPEAEKALSSSQGAKAVFAKTDVTKWDQLQAAFEKAISEFGQLDIVVPGAGIFEPAGSSNFWYPNQGTDTVAASSYKTFDLNITHPVRATQLAIDSFVRQKLGHGVVVCISSIAAQMALLPTPLYSTSKHAISGFVRCMAHLEVGAKIRVNGVAPGCVNTDIWHEDKRAWLDENKDTWVPVEKVVDTIIDLITNPEHVGGTILEVGVDRVRSVQELHDEGPSGRGMTVEHIGDAFGGVYGLLEKNFGK